MKAILLSDHEIEKFGVESWDETQARLYAAECAKETLHLYERTRPNDKRPRRAIEAAINYARMSTAEVPTVWVESSRRALEQAAEEAMTAAIEAKLNNKAAAYAAWAAAYASAVVGSTARNATYAICAARKAAETAVTEEA